MDRLTWSENGLCWDEDLLVLLEDTNPSSEEGLDSTESGRVESEDGVSFDSKNEILTGEKVGKYSETEIINDTLDDLLHDYKSPQYFKSMSDTYFYVPTPDELKSFVLNHQNDIIHGDFLSQGFDCDDFAFVFKGNICLYARDKLRLQASMCVGIAWGEFDWVQGYHAVNWALDSTGELVWIEPQRMEFHTLNECEKNSLTLLIV